MKKIKKSAFVLIGLVLMGADVYSSYHEDITVRNADCLSAASAKTGIPIVRQENFRILESVTTYDEITTCMSGSSQICNAGTVHVVVQNP